MENEHFYDLISPEEYFVCDVEIWQWPDEFKEIFQESCRITKGIVRYCDLNQEIIRDRLAKYTLKVENANSEIFSLEFELDHFMFFDTINLAKQFNCQLEQLGYKGQNYFFDISVDVGSGGLAFINFEIENKLVEQGILYRGDEYSNPEGLEYYWEKLKIFQNSNTGTTLRSRQSISGDKINETQLTYSRSKDEKLEKLISFPQNPITKTNKWWKFW